MKRLRRAGAAAGLALALASGATRAADERWDDLGPARIGTAYETISAALPLACDRADPVRTCTLQGGRFAGVPVQGIEASFRSDRLERVRVRLDTVDYPALLAALRARLGEPEDRSYRARAGMAGDFDAGVKLWVEAAGAVVLEQYAGKIDRAALTFGDAQSMDALVAQKRSYPPGAWRDL